MSCRRTLNVRCLAVKDIKASMAFYEKLDSTEVAGELDQNWLILNEEAE